LEITSELLKQRLTNIFHLWQKHRLLSHISQPFEKSIILLIKSSVLAYVVLINSFLSTMAVISYIVGHLIYLRGPPSFVNTANKHIFFKLV
jgi:hypothetical protein